MSDKQDEAQGQDPSVDAGRRNFIRKASYTAPALVALGAAAHSRRAQGQGFGGPPSAPGGSNPNSQPEDDPLLEDLENSENN